MLKHNCNTGSLFGFVMFCIIVPDSGCSFFWLPVRLGLLLLGAFTSIAQKAARALFSLKLCASSLSCVCHPPNPSILAHIQLCSFQPLHLFLHQCEQKLQRNHQQSSPQAQAFNTWIQYEMATSIKQLVISTILLLQSLLHEPVWISIRVLLRHTHWHCNTDVRLLCCLDCTGLLYDRRAWVYHIPRRHYTHAVFLWQVHKYIIHCGRLKSSVAEQRTAMHKNLHTNWIYWTAPAKPSGRSFFSYRLIHNRFEELTGKSTAATDNSWTKKWHMFTHTYVP